MAVIIQGGTGSGYRVAVTPTNRLKVDSVISGTPFVNIIGSISIGSVTATVGNVYIQSGANLIGSFYPLETIPTNITKNNPHYEFKYLISGTTTGVTGSEIGSIIQFIDTGSYIQIFTWTNNLITTIGEWC